MSRIFSRQVVLGCLLMLCTLLVFGESIGHEWVRWDDPINVYQNPYMTPPTWNSVERFWSGSYFNLYMPLTYTAWAGLAWLAWMPRPFISDTAGIYQLNPLVFHAAGVAFHAFNVLLVFAILGKMVKSPGAAALGALLFAVHPVQVESVVWVTGFNNVFSGTFCLLALWQYARFVDAEESRSRAVSYTVALICCALALLAKPTASTLPILAAIYLWWKRRENTGAPKASYWSLGPWFLLTFCCILLTRSAQDPHIRLPHSPLWARPLLVLDSLGFYIGKVVAPLALGIDYGRTPDFVLKALRAGALWWLLPIGLTLLVWFKRRQSVWPAAWGWFVTAVIPTAGLVPFYFHSISLVADRYLYLAMLGPALVLAFLCDRGGLVSRKLAAGTLAGLGTWSLYVGLAWTNSVSLNEQALRVNPRSWPAHNNLGRALYQKRDYSGAARQFEMELETRPDLPDAIYNLGLARWKEGRHAEAQALWKRAGKWPPYPDKL